jgi:hypothetical protein
VSESISIYVPYKHIDFVCLEDFGKTSSVTTSGHDQVLKVLTMIK